MIYLGNKKADVNYITADVPTPGSPKKTVFLYDPYGNKIASYKKADFLALTAYPTPPVLNKLTFQEYNWTLSDAKDFVTEFGYLNIGATYTTTSGLCEFDIELTKTTGLTITFAMLGNVNWGDGTSETVSASTTHTYSNYGKYTITCDGTTLPQYLLGQTMSTKDPMLVSVRLGQNLIDLASSYTFRNCYNLISITFPKLNLEGNSTAFFNQGFYNCNNLKSFTIPSNITRVYQCCQGCSRLESICLPNNLVQIDSSCFVNCYSLKNITTSLIYFTTNLFQNCYFLDNVSLRCTNNSGATINDSFLMNAHNLKIAKFTGNIIQINGNAFSSCNSPDFVLDLSDFTIIPTLQSTTAFSYINSNAKIIVPDNLYANWITASNWATFANYIYKASEVN